MKERISATMSKIYDLITDEQLAQMMLSQKHPMVDYQTFKFIFTEKLKCAKFRNNFQKIPPKDEDMKLFIELMVLGMDIILCHKL